MKKAVIQRSGLRRMAFAFLADESGQGLVAYTLILGLVSLAAVVALRSTGESTDAKMATLADEGYNTVVSATSEPEPVPKQTIILWSTLGPSTMQVAQGSTVGDIPEPLAEDGYEFAGWYSDAELTTRVDPTTVVAENMTLYPKFTEIQSTFTMTNYTGTTTPATVKIDGAAVAFSGTEPTSVEFTDEKTFTVTCEEACTVAWSNNDGATYNRLIATAVSGESNTYSFTLPSNAVGPVQIAIAIKGDVNLDGRLTIADSAQINAFVLGKKQFNALQTVIADVNDDGCVQVVDAIVVHQSTLGRIDISWWTLDSHTVLFVDDSVGVLQNSEVPYGEVPVYTGETPTKDPDENGAYIFTGWDPELAPVTGNTVYMTVFDIAANTFEIVNYTGTRTPATVKIDGAAVAFSGTEPTSVEFSDEKTFTVTCEKACTVAWSNNDGATYNRLIATAVSGESNTYSFTLPSNAVGPVQIAIAIKGDVRQDGRLNITDVGQINAVAQGVLQVDALKTVIADVDENGVINSADYVTEKYFNLLQVGFSWDTHETYTVIFAGISETHFGTTGAAILQQKEVPYGEVPAYSGDAIQQWTDIEPNEDRTYTFVGWDREFVAVTGNTVYEAVYSYESIQSNAYYFNYVISENNDEVLITGLSTEGVSAEAITEMPATIKGRPVTSIASNAFQDMTTSPWTGRSNVAFTSLPDTITTIGQGAFSKCQNLALTSLPSSLTSIGNSAFANCPNLALTSLPDSVTSIGGRAFYGCTNVNITTVPCSYQSDAFSGTMCSNPSIAMP